MCAALAAPGSVTLKVRSRCGAPRGKPEYVGAWPNGRGADLGAAPDADVEALDVGGPHDLAAALVGDDLGAELAP